jgi:hypothetical protein
LCQQATTPSLTDSGRAGTLISVTITNQTLLLMIAHYRWRQHDMTSQLSRPSACATSRSCCCTCTLV